MRTMLYRFFLASLMIIFLGGASHPVSAQDDGIYNVKGVQVDVNGNSALDARKKAFAEARRKAYGMIADKLLSAEQRPNLVIPDDKVLASLVRDFEIVNEKMTTKRYAGTLHIRFNPAAVKRTIEVADAPVAEKSEITQTADAFSDPVASEAQNTQTSAETAEEGIYSPRKKAVVPEKAKTLQATAAQGSVLVLPWYGPVGRQTLWGDNNPWRAAWETNPALSRDKSMPIVLPVGDVDDVRDYSPPQPLSRRGNIDALMKRYGASQVVLALAEKSSGGGLLVSLYQFQNGAPIPMGRFGMDASDNQNALAEAVGKAVASLKGLPEMQQQKASAMPVAHAPQQAMPTPTGGQYRTLARFSGLQQWVAMRQALARVEGVTGLNVRAISPSQASIDFVYGGDNSMLMAALARHGLQLAPAPEGISTGDRPAQYTLGFVRGY
ncbi:MAG: hypothetical protein EBQ96_01055 [Proteobacteria bacterium]|nr:hypothetical protein [Pseudomonadota bacterium]